MYPDTSGPIPAVTVDEWLASNDGKVWNIYLYIQFIVSYCQVGKVSLNPSKRKLVNKPVPLTVDDRVKSDTKKSNNDDQIKSETIHKMKSESDEKVKSSVSKDEVIKILYNYVKLMNFDRLIV